MWRRRFSDRWGRGRGARSGRRLLPYSYGTVVLLVSATILLILYLTGRLSI